LFLQEQIKDTIIIVGLCIGDAIQLSLAAISWDLGVLGRSAFASSSNTGLTGRNEAFSDYRDFSGGVFRIRPPRSRNPSSSKKKRGKITLGEK
jgi:hypothetical protein